jgi:hypothetical protein
MLLLRDMNEKAKLQLWCDVEFDGSEIEGEEGRLAENAVNVTCGTAALFILWVYFVPRSAACILNLRYDN